MSQGVGQGPQLVSTSSVTEIKCGPLLNYKRTSNLDSATPTWHGSVLFVTTPGNTPSSLSLKCLGPASSSQTPPLSGTPDRVDGGTPNVKAPKDYGTRTFDAVKLYEDPKAAFWRFSIDLPLQDFEAKWEYTIPNLQHLSGASTDKISTKSFFVPNANESMRIMFHSCNGFSLGTDEDAWSGCALWNDVLRKHSEKPLHVMIGGGDQIYNDNIRDSGPLREWCDIPNPLKRREYPFPEELRARCDEHYFNNYVKWYSTEPFASANGCIPQINIWDDHDIIDGFGSYTDHFMKCAVFRGIGGVAHKYYMLFQHHVPPPPSTFTTDAPNTTGHDSAQHLDKAQLKDTFVMKETDEDPSYVIGHKAGPYVSERSRSVFTTLGKGIAFLGIDARTERTRHQINYPETYDLLFNHVDKQLTAANGSIKHFILLLGVPIAYPRLQWLENILQSPAIGVVRFLSKRFGVAGGLFNNFDGGVDLMDDLDDHYTAHQHKRERKDLILRLQQLALKHSVRVTILGGDVHLCAFGRFYSNPSLQLPTEKDHRYMGNIVSSAITNHPPPAAVANLLARRNKIHHLDHSTDETLLNLFDKDPAEVADDKGVKKKSADANHCTMPSRNFAIISMSNGETAGTAGGGANGPAPNGIHNEDQHAPVHNQSNTQHHRYSRKSQNPRDAITAGEDGSGVSHAAGSGIGVGTGLGGPNGLDVSYRVEIDNHDRNGMTVGYGLSVPALEISEKEREAARKHGFREGVKRRVEGRKAAGGESENVSRPQSAPRPQSMPAGK